MKLNTLNLATIIITLLLLLSVGLNLRQNHKLEQKEEHYAELIAQGGRNRVVDRYTRDSITHTIFSEKLVSNGIAEKELAIGKNYADSLQRALKVSVDKISQATKINALLEARLALKEAESINGRRILSHQDKNLRLSYYPDTDSVELAMDIALNEARYKKRKWLLGKEENFIDVFPDDPRITIKGLKSFTVKEKPQRRLGIGVSAGYGIVQNNNSLHTAPYVGIGLNYNLVEF